MTSGVFLRDEVSLRTALAQDVRVSVAQRSSIGDVHNDGAFELASKQHNAAVALFLEQYSSANEAL